jgi:hypothetical protein
VPGARGARRRWLYVYAFVLSAAVGLPAGWALHRLAEARGVRPRWLWAAAGIWALLWTAPTRAWWLLAFYRAAIALVFGGHWPRHGGVALLAGWVFWTLLLSAALPPALRFFRSPYADDLVAAPRASTLPLLSAPAPRVLEHVPVPVPDGVELGRDSAARPGLLTDAEANTGVLVTGAPGAGKSNLVLRILDSVLARGLPAITIDGKGSVQLRRHLEDSAARAGRSLLVWTFSGPARYNPLQHGGPTELRDKLIAVESWTEPHYRRAAERYLGAVFSALAAAGEPASLPLIADLLFPKALEAFARRIPDEAHAKRLYAYIDSLDHSAASAIVGLGNRLATLVESEAGPWLQLPGMARAAAAAPPRRARGAPAPAPAAPPAPEPTADGPAAPVIDLLEAVLLRQPVLFSLDALRFPGLAAQVGALLLQDAKTVAAELLSRGNAVPCYLVIDEFNVFDGPQVLALLNKGREAGLCTVLATQDLSDVAAAGGETLVQQVLANTNVKLILRQDVDESANRLASAVGTRERWSPTHRVSDGEPTGESSLRQVDEFIVHPNLLKQLPPHHAVLVRKAPTLLAAWLRLWKAGV